MSLTFNSKTFTADSFKENAVGYAGPDKTLSSKDDLRLARVAPKPVPNVTSGKSRAQIKLVRTHALTGAVAESDDSITTIDIALPVGIAGADVDELCADFAAMFADADVIAAIKQQRVAF